MQGTLRHKLNSRLMNMGCVMSTSNVTAFKLFGVQYTTNKNREKEYSMDSSQWCVNAWYKDNIIYKIYLILFKKVKRLRT